MKKIIDWLLFDPKKTYVRIKCQFEPDVICPVKYFNKSTIELENNRAVRRQIRRGMVRHDYLEIELHPEGKTDMAYRTWKHVSGPEVEFP